MHKKKIVKLIETLQTQDNAQQKIAMVYRLLETANRYVAAVTEHTWKLQMQIWDNSVEHSQEVAEIDKKRTQVHNSLISLINSVNRLCENNSLPRLYDGEDERRQMGDFALELVETYFRDRIWLDYIYRKMAMRRHI